MLALCSVFLFLREVMCPMSLTFLQKAGPSRGHGPLGTLQPSGLSTDSSRAPAAPPAASGVPADAVWQSSGEEFGWIP